MNGGSNIRSFNDLTKMFTEEYKLTPEHFSLFIYQFTSPTRDQIDTSGGDGPYYPIEKQIQSVYDNMKSLEIVILKSLQLVGIKK